MISLAFPFLESISISNDQATYLLRGLSVLLEAKDRFIDKADFSDEQKTTAKEFFRKYPNYESKIDWQKPLNYQDIESLINAAKDSSSAKRREEKQKMKEDLNHIWKDHGGKVLDSSYNYPDGTFDKEWIRPSCISDSPYPVTIHSPATNCVYMLYLGSHETSLSYIPPHQKKIL